MSESNSPEEEISSVLREIRVVAKRNNNKYDITGVLFYHKGKFIQVLEGEIENLNVIIKKIKEDPRHRNIQYLVNEPIEKRGFPEWNMDTFNLSTDESLNIQDLAEYYESYRRNAKMDTLGFVNYIKDIIADPVIKNLINL